MYKSYKCSVYQRPSRPFDLGLYTTNVGSLEAEPNYEQRPRMLEDYYIIYIPQGAGSLSLAGQQFSFNKDSAFFLFPSMVHSYKTDPLNPLKQLWVGFNGRDSSPLLRETGFTPSCPIINCAGTSIGDIIQSIVNSSNSQFAFDYLSGCGSLYLLMAELMRSSSSTKPYTKGDAPYSRSVMKAHNFMNMSYHQPISIEDVCRHVNLSRAQLATLFKRELKQSPSQYLCYLRMTNAMRLLSDTRLPISEIAHSVGYEDALYFSKVFSKYFGMPPSEAKSDLSNLLL